MSMLQVCVCLLVCSKNADPPPAFQEGGVEWQDKMTRVCGVGGGGSWEDTWTPVGVGVGGGRAQDEGKRE